MPQLKRTPPVRRKDYSKSSNTQSTPKHTTTDQTATSGQTNPPGLDPNSSYRDPGTVRNLDQEIDLLDLSLSTDDQDAMPNSQGATGGATGGTLPTDPEERFNFLIDHVNNLTANLRQTTNGLHALQAKADAFAQQQRNANAGAGGQGAQGPGIESDLCYDLI